jgi:hypothetical protein
MDIRAMISGSPRSAKAVVRHQIRILTLRTDLSPSTKGRSASLFTLLAVLADGLQISTRAKLLLVAMMA